MKKNNVGADDSARNDDLMRIIEKMQHQHDNLQTWSECHAVHHIFSHTRNGVTADGYRRDDGQRAIRYHAGENDAKESIRFQSDDVWFLWEWMDGIGVIEHFEEISRKRL
jgi:hypothetical protein